jgi:hypothetical protein
MSDRQRSKTCGTCVHWDACLDDDHFGKNGECHFWPPKKSTIVNRLLSVEVENPRADARQIELRSLEELLKNLRGLNSDAFKSGKSFDDIKQIQKEILSVEQKIANLDSAKIKEYIVEERMVEVKRALWPTTASDDWCSQWAAKIESI